MSEDNTMNKIGSKKDLWHLVKQGILVQLHFDLETTALERDFAQITAYGDAAGDIAGNFLDSEEIEVRRPDRYLVTPQAAIITRTGMDELDDPGRVPHPDAMARIAQRFEHGPKILLKMGLPEREIEFETVRVYGDVEYPKERKETIVEYPMKDDKGNTVCDVRYHPKENKIAYRYDDDPSSPYFDNIENGFYRDPDGSKWKFVEPRVLVSGYRVRWADMFWLRTNLVRAGFHSSNTFFTHARSSITSKQKPKNFVVDTYTAVINTHLFGPEGEEGLKLDKRVDPQTGEDVITAKLEKVMTANTRYENEQRGEREGIRMPDDDSLYDKRKGHKSPAYDAKASLAAYNYSRTIAPDVIRELELQADEKHLRNFLPGNDPLDPAPPIYAMPRNTYPNAPTADPVAFISLDDRQGKLNTAMMIRLDSDLRNFTYKNKKLEDMRANDFALMIKEQGRSPDALIRLESVRKWPGIMPFRKALEGKVAGDWDMEKIEQVEENFRFLMENDRMLQEIRIAVELRNRAIRRRPEPANALMEEHATRNGFGDLDYLESKASTDKYRRNWRAAGGKRGEVASFSEMLYNMAIDDYKYYNMVDEALHRIALQPHPVDYSDDGEAARDFRELCRKLKRKLEVKDGFFDRMFNELLDKEMLSAGREVLKKFTAEEARSFRWKLKKRFLTDEVKMESDTKSRFRDGIIDYYDMRKGRVLFANASRDYIVVDKKGRQLDLDYLDRQYARNPNAVQDKFEDREWKVQFYRLSSKPSVTATLFQFADTGRLNDLSALWQKRYEVLKRYYLWGDPSAEPSQSRWPTIDKVRLDVKRLEVNARTRDTGAVSRMFAESGAGEAEVFLQSDEGQRYLSELSRKVEGIAKKNPMTPDFNKAARFDPKSGLPYDYIEYEVPAKGAVIIDVPDVHLRNPLEDLRFAPHAFVIKKLSESKKERIAKRAPVILRGEQTGRLYYAGPVDLKKAPVEKIGGTWSDFYGMARDSYEESGSKFPGARGRQIIITQTPVPIAHSRRDIDPTIQTVKVPTLHFDALVSPRLGNFDDKKPLTGLVLPVGYCPQEIKKGEPIRFREMCAPMGAKLTGVDGEDSGHIYESKLRNVTRMTVGDLMRKVSKKEITDKQAQRFGFAGAIDLWEKVNSAFINQESPNAAEEEIYLLEFDAVDKKSWALWDPPYAPVAAMTYGKEPVPPSAYRWFQNSAKGDFNSSMVGEDTPVKTKKAANDDLSMAQTEKVAVRKSRKRKGPAPS